jgi:hypothetical protein
VFAFNANIFSVTNIMIQKTLAKRISMVFLGWLTNQDGRGEDASPGSGLWLEIFSGLNAPMPLFLLYTDIMRRPEPWETSGMVDESWLKKSFIRFSSQHRFLHSCKNVTAGWKACAT